MIDSYADPGTPGSRTPGRYLWWLLTCQRYRALGGALLGTIWMVLITLSPYVLSRAIDDGLEPGRMGVLTAWSAALFVLGAFNAWVSIMRHRVMTRLRMDATFRTVKVVVGQATRLGAALPRQASTGEVVTIGVTDVQQISQSLTMTGPGVGSVVAYLLVAVLLLSVSVSLAAVVLLGVPVIALLVGPLLGRLRGAEATYREQQGGLAARIGDLAGGLRVLNGLGGKGLYADNFRGHSGKLVAQGYRVGAVTSWVQALGIGLPTLFLSLVTWLAARLAVQGSITVGEFVGVYGYVAVLVVPVAFFIESGYDITRGRVAASRVIRFLALRPDTTSRQGIADPPAVPSTLRDPSSGVEAAPGKLTALVSARPAESAAVVDRLGAFGETTATWGAVRLDEVAPAQVRDRVLVADNEADLFAGPLREMVSGRRERDPEAIARAVYAAVAQDIVTGLPDGLDSAIDAQGRNLSGGQRQRVRLVRALLADPEVLLAVEPTSALDAHTEAAVADRLRTARTGRTTVVTATSPLLLDQADTVFYLVDGKVAATGTHGELLAGEPGYRSLVARGEEDEADADGVGVDREAAPPGAPAPEGTDLNAPATAAAAAAADLAVVGAAGLAAARAADGAATDAADPVAPGAGGGSDGGGELGAAGLAAAGAADAVGTAAADLVATNAVGGSDSGEHLGAVGLATTGVANDAVTNIPARDAGGGSDGGGELGAAGPAAASASGLGTAAADPGGDGDAAEGGGR